MNDEMTTAEFLIWLRGYVDGVGNDITPEQWSRLLDKLKKVNTVDLNDGRSKKILHG